MARIIRSKDRTDSRAVEAEVVTFPRPATVVDPQRKAEVIRLARALARQAAARDHEAWSCSQSSEQ